MIKSSLFSRVVWKGAVAVALIFVWWLFVLFGAHGEEGSSVAFRVEKGESVFAISDSLAQKDIIKSRFVFWSYVALSGKAHALQAGEYEFSFPISLRRVALVLSGGGGGSEDVVVLIPEGFTQKQVGERLGEQGLAGADRFLSLATIARWQDNFSYLEGGSGSLEGFIFPDTYRLKPNMSSEALITRFLRNFENKTEDLQKEAKNKGKDFYDILILASILEKEVPVKDMPIAAGVLLKRISAGVPLQVDASLVYVLGRQIKKADIEDLDSPYNTYKYLGLPPGPISNPGIVAISATLNPRDSDYWYYLSRPSDGATIFSRTLDEHNEAVFRYLR